MTVVDDSQEKRKKQVQKGLRYAYGYLARRPRTAHEVSTYLQKKADEKRVDGTVIPAVLNELRERRYLDDQAYAVWYLTKNNQTRLKGRSLMQRELRTKGVSEADLADAIAQAERQTTADQPDDDTLLTEEEAARRALARRWHRYQSLDQPTRERRATAFLSRRGYGYGIIRKTIADLDSDRVQ